MLHAAGACAPLPVQPSSCRFAQALLLSRAGGGRAWALLLHGSAGACLSPQRWPTALPIALLCQEWVHVRGGGSACVGSAARPVSQREFIL
eukprot:COSAG01_NODE_725_length_14049_cov_7.712760_12_plen_91_part_00